MRSLFSGTAGRFQGAGSNVGLEHDVELCLLEQKPCADDLFQQPADPREQMRMKVGWEHDVEDDI